jgi:hypothetical protein
LKKPAALSFLMLIVVLVAPVACRREHAAQKPVVKTETIAPAPAPPSPTGSDAMTQTVDVEDSRSEAEGGVLTASDSTAAKPAAKAAKPPSKKKR